MMMEFLTTVLVWSVISLFVGYVTLCVVWPLSLALRETYGSGGENRRPVLQHSRLCVGRVWHTRFHPKRHSFTYPIFMFALDLQECTTTEDGPFFSMLHPIVRFQPHLYHLKNGEGKSNNNKDDAATATTFNLSQRIFNLIATKTQQQFQPMPKTHRILLLTHLEYYGYNFNPVSFYYILSRTTGHLDAVVGEVSNTPWTEMYCYVLHPDSIDNVQQHQLDNASYPNPRMGDPNTQFYRFPKTFHVSPFMEMEYWYDWTFQQTPLDPSFVVVNSLRRRTTTTNHDETKTQTTNNATKERLDFTARLELQTQPLTPCAVALQLIRFPIFCFVIQVWIHYQAAWLFLKGIVYVPHPQGSETAASKAIATLMIPFFAIRDRMESRKRSKKA